jgi:hypothetical protein
MTNHEYKKVLFEMARQELKRLQEEADEAFLVRAEMDKKLTSI